MGGKQPKATTSRPIAEYDRFTLRNEQKWTERELRQEYTRLRDIMRKSMKRMEKEWAWTDTYQYYKDRYPKLSELKDRKSIETALFDVAKFITKAPHAKEMQEARKATLKRINEAHGFSVNRKGEAKITPEEAEKGVKPAMTVEQYKSYTEYRARLWSAIEILKLSSPRKREIIEKVDSGEWGLVEIMQAVNEFEAEIREKQLDLAETAQKHQNKATSQSVRNKLK